MPRRPPDWQLPISVTPGLWDYLHDEALAQQYLAKVSDSPFAIADQRFVAQRLTTPGKVVDLGCGPGRSLLPLAQRGFSCLGVDLSSAMLEEARAHFAQYQLSAEWLQANLGEVLPIEDDSCEAVLCLFGTLGMPQPARARMHLLREALRITKPGGQLLLHVHNRWALQGWRKPFQSDVMTMPVHQGLTGLQMKVYTLTEIRQDLQQAGFRLEQVEYVSAERSDGLYEGRRWLAGFTAAGFLLAGVKPA